MAEQPSLCFLFHYIHESSLCLPPLIKTFPHRRRHMKILLKFFRPRRGFSLWFMPFLLKYKAVNFRDSYSEKQCKNYIVKFQTSIRWNLVWFWLILIVLTWLLLCEGDIGVHQAPSNAVRNKDEKMCSCTFFLIEYWTFSYHRHSKTWAELPVWKNEVKVEVA